VLITCVVCEVMPEICSHREGEWLMGLPGPREGIGVYSFAVSQYCDVYCCFLCPSMLCQTYL